MSQQPSGWYDDPRDQSKLRYWDGAVWTDHTTAKAAAPQNSGQPTVDQPAGAAGYSAGDPTADPWSTPTGGAAAGTQPQTGQPTGQQTGQQAGQQSGQQAGQTWGQPPANPYGQSGPPQAGGYPPQAGGYPPQAGGYPPQAGGYPPQAGYGLGAGGPYAAPPPAPGYGQQGAYWHAGGPTTPDGTPLAGYGARVGAYLLDGVFIGIIGGILASPFIVSFMSWYVDLIDRAVKAGNTIDTASLQGEMAGKIVPIVLIGAAVSLIYNMFFLMRTGATLGKRICGITVRLRDRPGPLSFVDALKRQAIWLIVNLAGLVPLLSYPGLLCTLLDLLWPAWDQRRQALHDKIAATNVVQAAPKSR